MGEEGDSESEVSAVLCLQQSRTCNMLFVLRKDLGFMKVDGNRECSLQQDWTLLQQVGSGC